MTHSTYTRKILLLFFVIFATGCTPITQQHFETHGYSPNDRDIQNIKQQRMTQKDIYQKYGKPAVIGLYDNNYWYYISYRTKQYGFSEKYIIAFRIVEMYFNNGYLEKVQRFDKRNLVNIKFSNNKTKTAGKQLGIFDQLLGNIGRVAPTNNGF